jgi:hypothetical protein
MRKVWGCRVFGHDWQLLKRYTKMYPERVVPGHPNLRVVTSDAVRVDVCVDCGMEREFSEIPIAFRPRTHVVDVTPHA